MTSSTASKKIQLTGRNLVAVSAVGILFSWVVLCFCSFLPFVLFLSFLFNGVLLGTSLFSALAQEREKRTIDALRLTQLTSPEILLYKSLGELRSWKLSNGIFIGLAAVAALWSGSPLLWAVAGAVTLACGGLLSIALALAVSTRCETTSSAVVSGWVTKGVWLVGLPILDYVLEAVLVLGKDLNFFSYLDPAWIYGTVVSALIFETNAWSVAALMSGAAATVGVAFLLVRQSSHMIDTSFETSATLEDRHRHSAYSRRFAFGLHHNPFMVREMAWQMRTGAGAWPGYAVFLTLFLAPFLYGLAQQHKHHEATPVKVVRQSVAQPANVPIDQQSSQIPQTGTVHQTSSTCGKYEQRVVRYHGSFCLSRQMGLPVPTKERFQRTRAPQGGERIVVDSHGKVSRIDEGSVSSFQHRENSYSPTRRQVSRSHLETELDRGLLTGLLLALCYLFIRGGAFMSGAVTGEKERRAWDQIALTGASPDGYLKGKLAGVLYFPLKQLLMTSPILILFAAFGGVSLVQVLLVVPLLFASFLAAGSLGLLASTSEETSHQAQGKALLAALAILAIPFAPGGWLLAGFLTFVALRKTGIDSGERLFAAGSVAIWVGLWGAAASPIAGVMKACQYDGFGPLRMSASGGSASFSLLVGILSMALLGYGAFRLAVRSLQQGGSVKA
jgi:hypothetical protein